MIILGNNEKKDLKIPLIKEKSLFNSSIEKNAICILTNQPDEKLIFLYNSLINDNYDFYVIVNDYNFNSEYLEKKYEKFKFVKFNKTKDNSNFSTEKSNYNLWENVINYFCDNKLNIYEYIWFIEDTVLVTSSNLIYKIDKKHEDYYIDFLSKKPIKFSKDFKNSKKILDEIPDFLHNNLCFTLVSCIRISNYFLSYIKKYLDKNKKIFLIEYFFCTLANYYDLKTKDPIEFNNMIKNKDWKINEILKTPLSFIYPIKDIYKQIYIRKFFEPSIKINEEIIKYFEANKNKIENKQIETKKSALKINKKMIELDIKIQKLFKRKKELFNKISKPNFRFYTNKNINPTDIFSKKNAFVTTVFINESYIGSALILAKSFIIHKTIYPLICVVQDKPYIKKKEIIFPGVSNKGINDLLKYFDLVVGVDLLEVKNYETPIVLDKPNLKHTSAGNSYKNSKYYPTKLQVFGLFEFEQLFYIDAAAYLGQNIDFVFKKYKGNYFHDKFHYFTKSGAGGSHFMIEPNPISYYKLILFTNNYQYYFDHLFFTGTVDETLLFYCVYPHWNGLIEYHSILSYKKWKHTKKDTPIRHFMKYKPFRPLPDEYEFKLMPEGVFNEWDLIGKKVINQYPEFKKYYEHIVSFRKTKLFN